MRYQNAFTRSCSYSVPRIYPLETFASDVLAGRTITFFPRFIACPQLYSLHCAVPVAFFTRVLFYSVHFMNGLFKHSLSIPFFREKFVKKEKSTLIWNASNVDIFFEKMYEQIGINKDNYRGRISFNSTHDAVLYYYRSTPYKLVALIYAVSHVVTQQSESMSRG